MQFSSLLDRLKDRLRKNISEDRATFLTCIAIALIFWWLVKMSNYYLTEKPVLFSFSLPEGKAFSVYPPEEHTVEIRGTGWGLMFEFFSNPKIRLHYNLADENPQMLNQMRLSNDISNQFASKEINISRYGYDGFSVALEDRIEKEVPIRLLERLSYADEYHLRDSITMNPGKVTVSGPESLVRQIEFWTTDSLILENLNNSVAVDCSLREPSKEIELNFAETRVEIPVEQYTERSFLIPVKVRNAPDSLKIFPEKIKLTCVIGLSQYNEISSKDFSLQVDLKEAEKNGSKNTVPVVLTHYPPYVTNVVYAPRAAEFFIIKKDSLAVEVDKPSIPQ